MRKNHIRPGTANGHIRQERGTVMLYLIAMFIIFGLIGAAMVSIYSSANNSQAVMNQVYRSDLSADSGLRWAMSQGVNSGEAALSALNQVAQALNSQSSFTVSVYPYSDFTSTSGGSTITSTVGLAGLPAGYPSSLGSTSLKVKIGQDTLYNVTNLAYNSGTKVMTLTVNGTTTTSDKAFLVFTTPSSTQNTFASGGSLTIANANIAFFPSKGSFNMGVDGSYMDENVFYYTSAVQSGSSVILSGLGSFNGTTAFATTLSSLGGGGSVPASAYVALGQTYLLNSSGSYTGATAVTNSASAPLVLSGHASGPVSGSAPYIPNMTTTPTADQIFGNPSTGYSGPTYVTSSGEVRTLAPINMANPAIKCGGGPIGSTGRWAMAGNTNSTTYYKTALGVKSDTDLSIIGPETLLSYTNPGSNWWVSGTAKHFKFVYAQNADGSGLITWTLGTDTRQYSIATTRRPLPGFSRYLGNFYVAANVPQTNNYGGSVSVQNMAVNGTLLPGNMRSLANTGTYASTYMLSQYTTASQNITIEGDVTLSWNTSTTPNANLGFEVVIFLFDVPSATEDLIMWSFDEGTGRNVNDKAYYGQMGTHYSGTTASDATWTTGISCGAINFRSAYNNHVWIPDNDRMDLTTAGTLSLWIKPTSFVDWAGLIHKGDQRLTNTTNRIWNGSSWSNTTSYGVGSDEAYTLQFDDNRHVVMGLVDCSLRSGRRSLVLLTSTGALSTGNWYHVVGLWDSTSIRMYINGALNTQINMPPSSQFMVQATAGGLNVATQLLSTQDSYPFNGVIDEVMIYGRALSVAEINQIWATQNSPLAAP